MARKAKATRGRIERVLREYEQTKLTRRQFCEQRGIAEHTLHYYQRRLREMRERDGEGTAPVVGNVARLARVEIAADASAGSESEGGSAFALVLGKGRRVEVAGWDYCEQDLARLIRVVEGA